MKGEGEVLECGDEVEGLEFEDGGEVMVEFGE